jgi:GNAT superfamily N-acetyltransferase
MTKVSRATTAFEFRPLTPERWPDLVRLFGERGACGGCWCMWWRRLRPDFERGKGYGNRRAFERVVASGEPPGLLAYAGTEPVGWVALAPRDAYPRLARSRTLKPVDEARVWSITCLFVLRVARRQGLSVRLLQAAIEHAALRGATIVEGYPVDAANGRLPDAFVWTGLAGAFRDAGFEEVARRSPTRPIMRAFPRGGSAARRVRRSGRQRSPGTPQKSALRLRRSTQKRHAR